jgi:hypothetical protein
MPFCEVLNPQMAQIDADGEKDKQTAQELERPCLAERSTGVEALVPRARWMEPKSGLVYLSLYLRVLPSLRWPAICLGTVTNRRGSP